MKFNIALIKGDGIGPEIIESACQVLDKVGKKFGHEFVYTDIKAGGCAIDEFGVPLPDGALEECLKSDSVMLGAVGGPKWDNLPGDLRPERALLNIRKGLELFANLRPARLIPELKEASPLRRETTEKGFDLLIVRELTGGMYFGKSGRYQSEDGETAFDTETYSVKEIRRIGKVAFETARTRRNLVTSIDKANVMESSRLWRETMHELAKEYPDVELRDMLVDNAAMQLVQNPAQFDVIVTSNIFGDILSDEASQLTGSIGLLPSASLGETKRGMYEPIHGSAPDIAGKDMANPIATVLSAAMMLRLSFGLHKEAAAVEKAVDDVLAAGLRTKDIAWGGPSISGSAMTKALLERL
ncbi:MAG: 3-isopropylmalate dehydrogenase [Christensenellaceae bacterium]|nr:3-isopropylmalate dehydrogenase [Christensenellaceae bacterium]